MNHPALSGTGVSAAAGSGLAGDPARGTAGHGAGVGLESPVGPVLHARVELLKDEYLGRGENEKTVVKKREEQ